MLNRKILSIVPFLCLLLCVPHHCGRGEEEADGHEVGQSALLKLMQSCCDLFWELGNHAHVSKLLSWGACISSDVTPSSIYLDPLSAVNASVNVNNCSCPQMFFERGEM